MPGKDIRFKAIVEKFLMKGGWTFVRVPDTIEIPETAKKSAWSYIFIKATVGKTSWDSFLLPMGNKTFFIALKEAVRKKEKIKLGDTITVQFSFT